MGMITINEEYEITDVKHTSGNYMTIHVSFKKSFNMQVGCYLVVRVPEILDIIKNNTPAGLYFLSGYSGRHGYSRKSYFVGCSFTPNKPDYKKLSLDEYILKNLK